jgi:hypothetical protein
MTIAQSFVIDLNMRANPSRGTMAAPLANVASSIWSEKLQPVEFTQNETLQAASSLRMR